MFHQTGTSLTQYNTLHPKLKAIADAVGHTIEFQIVIGYRDKAGQDLAYAQHNSKAKWLESAHNYNPSVAFDFLPHPFNGWGQLDDFRRIARAALKASVALNIPITWGGDWNRNASELDEHGLRDFGHLELYPWRSFINTSISPKPTDTPDIASIEATN